MSESFPKFLVTGSMLSLVNELVENAPVRIGPYRILERIGGGGMGVVYLAEQDPPLVRRVAIKLARNAVADDRALARFESERQTLAVMNHPNIARVFDAGSAPDARPYFVMEYVAGESITEFCESRRIGIEQRLLLFLRVCDGVQHAHLNAIIHRDLKPANILVATEGGTPTPKIIDFGVAKALDNPAGPTVGLTQFGQIVGTPEYMSPEQAALDGRSVDSRTDVYSLGVVLYELLVGSRPFERGSGPDASFVDLCRRIREEEPERPSVRAARSGALARRLRGDLDAIAIKALAKDPQGRYASPSDLAADIERHLQHRPIRARSPGAIVRLRKFIERHRSAAAVVAVLSATLIGLAVFGTAQAVKAQRESARVEAEARIGNAVRSFVLNVIDPRPPLGSYTRPREILTPQDQDAFLDRIGEQFSDQPLLQAQLRFAVENHLIAYNDAARDFHGLEASRERITSVAGPDSEASLAATETLARAYWFHSRAPDAERLLFDVLERRRRLAGADDPSTWRTTVNLATLYRWTRRSDKSAPLLESAIAGLERRLGPDDRDVLSTKVGLSDSYLELGRHQDSRLLLESSIDRIRRVFGEQEHQTMVAHYNLACAHANLGNVELALDHLRQSTALGWTYPRGPARDPQLLPLHGDPRFEELDREARLNDRPHWPMRLHHAQLHIQDGRLADAERLLLGLIAAIERGDRTGAGGAAIVPRLALATCRIRQGKFDEAEALLLPTLAAVRAGGTLVEERRTLELLVQCDIGRGRRDSALTRIAAIDSVLQPVFEDVEKYYGAAQRQALGGQYDEALRSLALASEFGFNDFDRLEHDLAFAKLRTRSEFRAVAKSARRRAF